MPAPTFLGAGPGCGCNCASCTVATDDFNRADSTTIGGGWTEDAGDFTIAGNKLVTDDANARAINSATTASGRGIVRANGVVSSTNGAIARVLGAYSDSNNYLIVEVIFNTGSIQAKLFRRVGGTNTQMGSTTTNTGYGTGDAVDVRLCWTGYGAHVYVYEAGTSTIVSQISGSTSLSGTQGGLGTGATTGGDVSFDEWGLYNDANVSETCEYCWPCATCADQVPSAWQVEILNATGTDCFAGCVGLTFTVPNTTGCGGSADVSSCETTYPILSIALSEPAFDDPRITVTWSNNNPFDNPDPSAFTEFPDGDCMAEQTVSGSIIFPGTCNWSVLITPLA